MDLIAYLCVTEGRIPAYIRNALVNTIIESDSYGIDTLLWRYLDRCCYICSWDIKDCLPASFAFYYCAFDRVGPSEKCRYVEGSPCCSQYLSYAEHAV